MGAGSWLVLLNANDMFHGIEPVRPVEEKSALIPSASVGT